MVVKQDYELWSMQTLHPLAAGRVVFQILGLGISSIPKGLARTN